MELNVDEALRYLGIDGQAAEPIRAGVAAVTDKLTVAIQPRYTYHVCSLQKAEAGLLLSEAELVLPGADAAKMLEQCDQAVLMACTLGTQFEALPHGEQARDMPRAVILAAYGNAWIEAGCDQVEQEPTYCLPNRYRADRFSPGYGDLPLSLQPKICAALDTQRRLGLYVTESHLMNPSKSATTIIDLSDWPQMTRIRGCTCCSMRETYKLRAGGKHCGN